ncbi:hypothetical protein [Thermogladius sp.]|uniref:hypothetical protein n=1 Tax=Thermogladius sp. TaxID=2023064 RepID=UPI003D126340
MVKVVVASSKLGLEFGSRLSRDVERGLASRGLGGLFAGLVTETEHVSRLTDCDVGVVVVATGGTEGLIVALGERCQLTYVLYHYAYNSLPATLEAAALLRVRGRRVRLGEYRGPEDAAGLVERIVRVVEGVQTLRGCRLGVIGGVSPWLVYSRVDPEVVKRKLGSEVVYIPMEELLKEFDASPPPLRESVLREAREVLVDSVEVEKALRLYTALESLAKRHSLCGLTVKCFDLITLRRVTACLSMALFNTRLFPAACEGDVPLLLSMALGELVTRQPVFMGNPAVVRRDEVLIAHCTAPLVSSFRLMTHFESGLGVGVSVDYPVGAGVTVYRLTPDLETLRVGVGRVKQWSWRGDMCRTQVLVEVKGAERIVRESIGNHYALVLGDWSNELSLAGELLGLRVEELE